MEKGLLYFNYGLKPYVGKLVYASQQHITFLSSQNSFDFLLFVTIVARNPYIEVTTQLLDFIIFSLAPSFFLVWL